MNDTLKTILGFTLGVGLIALGSVGFFAFGLDGFVSSCLVVIGIVVASSSIDL